MERFSVSKSMIKIERVGYFFVFLPFFTDFLETGHWPQHPRQILTEITSGVLILFYVRVIRSARKRLNQLERDREEMTSLLLHDMRNPLTIVINTLLSLEKNPDHPDGKKWIKAALRSCRQDVDLMTEMAQADRLEGKKFLAEKRPVNLPELLRLCAEEMSAPAAQKGVLLNVSHAPEVETVPADEDLLRRVLLNLMRNALKFTKSEGRLTLDAEIRRGWLVVKVRDTGIGIAPESMKRLFGRFSRIQDSGGMSADGWGLGLYFCKMAVEAHGGRIEIHSRPGTGTLVRFAIPTHQRADLPNEGIGDIKEDFESSAPRP